MGFPPFFLRPLWKTEFCKDVFGGKKILLLFLFRAFADLFRLSSRLIKFPSLCLHLFFLKAKESHIPYYCSAKFRDPNITGVAHIDFIAKDLIPAREFKCIGLRKISDMGKPLHLRLTQPIDALQLVKFRVRRKAGGKILFSVQAGIQIVTILIYVKNAEDHVPTFNGFDLI